MKVVIVPFFSQQNKLTRKFLLYSCGSTKTSQFLAKKIVEEFNWRVTIVLPYRAQCHDQIERIDGITYHEQFIPPDNLDQRLHFVPTTWRETLSDAQLLISGHEVLPFQVRHLFPNLKIILMNTVVAEEPWPWMEPLLLEAWKASDVLVGLGPAMSEYLRGKLYATGMNLPDTKVRTWRMAFDPEEIEYPFQTEKKIDLLFVLRCSATNYTRHREFILALKMLRNRGWNGSVVFTDVTRYLRSVYGHQVLIEDLENVSIFENPGQKRAYAELLHSSRVAIAMNDNMHGGAGLRQAIWAGAFPLPLRARGYEALMSKDWAWYIERPTPVVIAETILQLFEFKPWEKPGVMDFARQKVEAETFQNSWYYEVAPCLRGLTR